MRENKSFASLSSGLLARKGGAKPAMRPQGFNSYGGSLEDLGWDDMGHSDDLAPEHVPSPVTALTPSPGATRGHHPAGPEQAGQQAGQQPAEHAEQPAAPQPQLALRPVPAVVEQQISLRQNYADAVVELPRRRSAAPGVKAKAAFTLRLDPERHLKLRLASAITRDSAQHLVTAALDDFLNSLPELDALAERVPAEAGQRGR